jgi:hypothetical protein
LAPHERPPVNFPLRKCQNCFILQRLHFSPGFTILFVPEPTAGSGRKIGSLYKSRQRQCF